MYTSLCRPWSECICFEVWMVVLALIPASASAGTSRAGSGRGGCDWPQLCPEMGAGRHRRHLGASLVLPVEKGNSSGLL